MRSTPDRPPRWLRVFAVCLGLWVGASFGTGFAMFHFRTLGLVERTDLAWLTALSRGVLGLPLALGLLMWADHRRWKGLSAHMVIGAVCAPFLMIFCVGSGALPVYRDVLDESCHAGDDRAAFKDCVELARLTHGDEPRRIALYERACDRGSEDGLVYVCDSWIADDRRATCASLRGTCDATGERGPCFLVEEHCRFTAATEN